MNLIIHVTRATHDHKEEDKEGEIVPHPVGSCILNILFRIILGYSWFGHMAPSQRRREHVVGRMGEQSAETRQTEAL